MINLFCCFFFVFLQPFCLHLSGFHFVGATAGWCKGLLCFHEFEGQNQSQMFWPQFWSCRQLTLCPSGLRGWTQVSLVQTAWVQIPQVSYGSGLKVATGNCWPTETHCSSRDLSSESPSWLRERLPEPSLCGQSLLDFESNSLAAWTQCLLPRVSNKHG